MTTVVGSGTGANYAITAGALARFEEDGLDPTELWGASGSCLGFGFRAAGRDMGEFLTVAMNNPPMKLIKPNWRWPLTPGLFHLDKVVKVAEPFLPKTFADCQIPFTVIAFDSDRKTELRFGPETPNAPVAKAVQASMSIPWAMRHVNIKGIRATDGGIVRNFPIDLPDEPAVGIRVLGAGSQGKPWRWWGSYSWNHVDGMLMALEREHVEDAIWKRHKIITIRSPISGMDFHKVDAAMIERLFNVGYQAVDDKLQQGWSWE